MSIETAAVSVPAKDKLIEEKVSEEAPEIKGDSSPCRDDVPKVEKKELIAENSVGLEVSTTKVEETPEDNQSGIPIVVENQTVDNVPAGDGAKEVESSGPESEATSTKETACETVEIQREIPTIETVEDVAVEKPAVKSVENLPVEETTIEADEYKPVEKVAVEEVEKEAEKAETIEPDESTPVDKVAIEEVKKEAEKEQTVEADENVLVETVASDVVDKEAETAQAIQDVISITPVEKEATEEIEKEAEKAETILAETILAEQVERVATEVVDKEPETTQAIEADENTPLENVACEEVEKEAEKEQIVETQVETAATETVDKELETTQAIEADCTKLDEKPDIEAVEKQIDDAKQEVEVTTDSAVSAVEEAQTTESKADEVNLISDAEKTVENTESKAGVVDLVGGLLKEEETLACENAADKEEKIVKTEQQTEENKKTEASSPNEAVLENRADVADRELVDEAKEVLVKEDVYKDIKENEEVVVPSAAVEPPQEHKNSLLDVMAMEKSSKPDDEANKLENAEETTKESKDEKQEVVSVKSAQKQSGGIISKVKQSIVKVKKAIIGKSPSSKVLTPEVKEDELVK